MIEQIANSTICWVILLLALFTYQQLFLQYLTIASSTVCNKMSTNANNSAIQHNCYSQYQHEFTSILIGALPLLGLLGTIVGLLQCFAGIASQGANSQVMSAGISDALLTTQLGLVCAVPAWLLQAWVRTQIQNKLRLTAENTLTNNQPVNHQTANHLTGNKENVTRDETADKKSAYATTTVEAA
ncbi:MotA/TolQ/ExbB proton channel family protein [Colwellia echini]|uniref:MotA/TolQ/ExbB proton channel domain-containing protein n=1 Tax=Colwellia echini TaxID=1982103 RepID=A0ABY3MUX4_9GAMM|nr:MotA/TolQ/ExbB proton channel family protein [Colwellia echini]TYK64984.1 hypothetical protein CWS31_012720 [Colwellia echini]